VKETFRVLNRMEADGVIGRYAIGGAVGALFYLEPADTADIDVFVSFRETPGNNLVTLAPLYHYLGARGFSEHEKEGIVIEGWPVQFLPAADALGEEALAQAVDTDLEGVPTRIMTPEHLAAIALQTGRGKDLLRLLSFVESGCLDPGKLDSILKRHGLVEKWKKFEDKYLQDDSNP